MKFGSVPLAEAEGAILAHSVAAGPRRRIAKGTVLEPAHLAALAEAGLREVTVACLEPGDLDENAAAARLAGALVPAPERQGLRISAAGAGRVNLYATAAGVLRVDAAAVTRLNMVDPMITLATLPPLRRLSEGQMAATIKIISYAVPAVALEAACAAGRDALTLARPRFGTATLIETRVGDAVPPIKGRRSMAERLARLGIALTPRMVVPHQAGALAGALRAAPGEMVMILTASATSDIEDVAPAALRQAGGTVTIFGLPVDPGNLLFFGALGERPVIGLPGCARSPALNGADWVLERLACGIAINREDVAAMGVGGLLKEIPTRPRPREG